jgi:steroid delta-isomerase-like uncharacterized protein
MKRQKRTTSQYNQRLKDASLSLEIVSKYVAALGARDSASMHALRSPTFVLDFVHGDAFHDEPLSADTIKEFWSAWFAGFPDMDFEGTRTVAAENVVIIQWIFTGHNTGPLEPPISGRHIDATGRTIRLRGVSVYDISEGLIQRETLYMDFATLWVELGVEV